MSANTNGSQGRADAICDALRRAVLEQALKPGTKLPEDALGERFGVSRTIARHALGQLAAEGLVDLQRNRGATVAKPSWEDARDLFDVRTALEQVVMSRLSGRLTPQQVKALREHVQKEEGAAGESDPVAIRLATEFHLLLAEMTDSPVLMRYVRELCLRCGLTLALHGRPHSSDCAISEHLEIIEALRAGDEETAMRCMCGHLESVATRALIEPSVQAMPDLMQILEPYARRIGRGAS
ncbi:MAG: GntR family transcriptional regulator [Flavobacteriaceae bacterium]